MTWWFFPFLEILWSPAPMCADCAVDQLAAETCIRIDNSIKRHFYFFFWTLCRLFTLSDLPILFQLKSPNDVSFLSFLFSITDFAAIFFHLFSSD